MKKFKGTKGEWKSLDCSSERKIIESNDGLNICDVWYDLGDSFPKSDEGLANAKLIVSSPILLEALQDCKTTIEWLVENGNVNQNLLETFCNISANSLELADNAINKAL